MSAINTYPEEYFWTDQALDDFVPFGTDDSPVFGIPQHHHHHFFGPPMPQHVALPPYYYPMQFIDRDNKVIHHWHQHQHQHQLSPQPDAKFLLHTDPNPGVQGSGEITANATPTTSSTGPGPGPSLAQSPLGQASPPADDEVADGPECVEPRPSKRGRRSTTTDAGFKKAAGYDALERNRLAATNFRKRTKESLRKLESAKAKLESKNQELRSECSELSCEVLRLKNDLMLHAPCHDDKIDIWIKREAYNYIQELVTSDEQQPNFNGFGPF